MRTPPRFFAKKFSDSSACWYYRVEQVLRMLDQNHGVHIVTGGEWEAQDETEFKSYLMTLGLMDFVFYYASGGETTKQLVRFLNKIKAVGDEIPPAYLADLDDNCDYINPLNSRFGRLGTRMPNGRLLKPDECVNIILPDGESVPIWDPERDDICWADNQKSIKAMNWTFKHATGITFSTQRLADYYTNRYRLQNVYVRHNAIIPEDFPDIRLQKDPGVIKLFWQGGDAHYPDFYPMKEALTHAMEKFPELKLVLFGPLYPWVIDAIGEDRIEHHEWVSYDAYKIKLASIDFDISMCPLVGNKFNQYKSCIKWYEISSLATPKPTLAAREAPYKDEIHDGLDGLLFDMPTKKDPIGLEFQRKLELLIRDEKMRRTLAENGRKFINESRLAKDVVADYWLWCKDTHARHERSKRNAANR